MAIFSNLPFLFSLVYPDYLTNISSIILDVFTGRPSIWLLGIKNPKGEDALIATE